MDSRMNDITVRMSEYWMMLKVTVSEAEDIGDRVVHSNRYSDSVRNPLANVTEENGFILKEVSFPLPTNLILR
ncbi:hypothetical protein LIER_30613 [Lithospermum erythrorhizon]|uniref:Uncharacterized protein n=1 Tax=Lithospermum erythrorhizon TaxID=34254 RepID=A0AAV3RQK7_LITER